jgi:hypothetical protein
VKQDVVPRVRITSITANAILHSIYARTADDLLDSSGSPTVVTADGEDPIFKRRIVDRLTVNGAVFTVTSYHKRHVDRPSGRITSSLRTRLGQVRGFTRIVWYCTSETLEMRLRRARKRKIYLGTEDREGSAETFSTQQPRL